MAEEETRPEPEKYFCPNCKNIQVDGSRICRVCGDNVRPYQDGDVIVKEEVKEILETKDIVPERTSEEIKEGQEEASKIKKEFDLNDDGVVDGKDKSLAARVLATKKKKKKR